MRICVIGNSHAAALKSGWDRIGPDWPDRSLTFFAAIGMRLRHLQSDGAVLRSDHAALKQNMAATSGGSTEIDLSAYDLFLIAGLLLEVPLTDPRQSAAVRTFARNAARNSLAVQLARMVRKGTDRPIVLLPEPLKSASQDSEDRADRMRSVYAGEIAELNAGLDIVGARICGQPAQTIVGGGTDAVFSRAAPMLQRAVGDSVKKRAKGDDVHMNGDFGALWLGKLFDELSDGGAGESADATGGP